MLSFEIADDAIRGLVKDLQTNGMPSPQPLTEELLRGLSKEQIETLKNLSHLSDQQQSIIQPDVFPEEGDEAWNLRLEIRTILQQALRLDLVHLKMVQDNLVFFGALPDPQKDWRYFICPDFKYYCWQCGSEVMSKTVYVSIHYKELRPTMAGGGEVETQEIWYCPQCGVEPSSYSSRTESIGESLSREQGIARLC